LFPHATWAVFYLFLLQDIDTPNKTDLAW